MNSRDLQPVCNVVRKGGIKILAYGGPGTGKTPICQTATNPCICAIEHGLMSIKDSRVPCYVANSVQDIKDYVKWATESTESKQYTHCLDSLSEMCSFCLVGNKSKDGRKVYGDMANDVLETIMKIDGSDRNWYLVAKEESVDTGTIIKTRPNFPGNVLPVQVPHLFDGIFHVEYTQVPDGNGGVKWARAFRTRDESGFYLARARSLAFDTLEPANLAYIMDKWRS